MNVKIKLDYKKTHKDVNISRVVIPFMISGNANILWFSYFKQEIDRYQRRSKSHLYVKINDSNSMRLEIPLDENLTKEFILDIETDCQDMANNVNGVMLAKNIELTQQEREDIKLQEAIEEIRGME